MEKSKPFGIAGTNDTDRGATRSDAEKATELRPQKAF